MDKAPPTRKSPPFPRIPKDPWEFPIPNAPHNDSTLWRPFGEGRSQFLPWKTKLGRKTDAWEFMESQRILLEFPDFLGNVRDPGATHSRGKC